MSKTTKQEIEQLYINAVYNDEAPSNFASKVLECIGVDESRETRSYTQSKARWKYLTMVANILNDRGDNYQPYWLDDPVRFTKEILYETIWQTLRHTLYPKKKRQLNTKEFCNLVEHLLDLMALKFDIHIPFPNIENFLMQRNA